VARVGSYRSGRGEHHLGPAAEAGSVDGRDERLAPRLDAPQHGVAAVDGPDDIVPVPVVEERGDVTSRQERLAILRGEHCPDDGVIGVERVQRLGEGRQEMLVDEVHGAALTAIHQEQRDASLD
jgi:hypothetical protein